MAHLAPVLPRDVRPLRLWFMVPGVIALAGVTAAVATMLGLWSGGLPHRTFAAGETVTIHLNQQVQADIYATSPSDARCLVLAPSGRRIPAEPVSGAFSVNVHGTRWYLLSKLRPPMTGTYQVTCPASAGMRYGISSPPGVGALLAGLIGGFALAVAAGMITFALIDRRDLDRRGRRSRPGGRPGRTGPARRIARHVRNPVASADQASPPHVSGSPPRTTGSLPSSK